MGQDRNFSMHVALLTAVDDAGEGFKLGNAQHAMQRVGTRSWEQRGDLLPWACHG